MRKPSQRLLLFVLATCCSLLTQVYQSDAQSKDLSIEFALKQSIANPSRVAGELAAIRLASANEKTTPSVFQPDPEVRITQVDRWSGNDEQEYSLRLRTKNPWVLKSERKAHGHRIEMAQEQLEVRKWQIQHQTKYLYFEALYAQKTYDLLKDWQVALQENLKWHESLLESSQQTLPEVLEVRIETNKAIRDARKAQLNYQKALNVLLSWINHSPLPSRSKTIELTTDFSPADSIEGNWDEEKIYKEYSFGHPLPKTFLALESIAQAQVQGADAGHKPWVSFLQAGVSQSSNSWEGDDWRFRVGIEVPIFNQQNKLTDAARAQQDFARSQLEAHLFESRLQIREKIANVEFAARHLKLTESLTRNILDQVSGTLDEDRATPTLSPNTRFRLQRGIHRMNESNLEAQYALQQAIIELEYFQPLETN